MRATQTLVPLLAVVGLLVASAPASAGLGCESIGRVQTYEGWGPALHYGETVTAAFSVRDCSVASDEGTFSFELVGSAVVFAGKEASGQPIDVRPFESEGSWTDPQGTGWPPAWWSCGVEEGSLRWEIPEVYSFVVGVIAGTWILEVSPGEVRWTYAAC